MKKRLNTRWAALVAFAIGSAGAERSALAAEEPEYKILERRDGFEVRRYRPYMVAQTTVGGDERAAGNSGFRILAGYIFGNNTASTKMEMTIPVTTRTTDAPSATGTKMEMTAPVTVSKNEEDKYVMRFVMEGKYTMESLPKPKDPRVEIVEIPERTVAVLRYRGNTGESRYQQKRKLLLKRLVDARIETRSQPVKAVFNGPWTPGFLRRNEVQVDVEWPVEARAKTL